jgi:hypothetical protein
MVDDGSATEDRRVSAIDAPTGIEWQQIGAVSRDQL